MDNKFYKGKEKSKYVYGCFIVFIVMCLIFGMGLSSKLRKEIKEESIQNFEDKTIILAEKMNANFTQGQETVRQMLNHEVFPWFIKDTYVRGEVGEYEHQDFVQKELKNIDGNNDALVNAWVVIEGEKDLLLTADVFVSDEYKTEIRPWYQDMIKREGVITYTRPYKSYSLDEIVFGVVTPIYDEENLVGEIGIEVGEKSIRSNLMLGNKKKEANLFLLTGDGEVVLRTCGRECAEIVDTDSFKEKLPIIIKNDSGVEEFRAEGKRYYAAYSSFQYSGWYVIEVLPEEEVFKDGFLIRLVDLNLILIILAITLLLIYVNKAKKSIEKYSANILKQQKYIRKMAEEDPLTKIPNRRVFDRRLKNSLKDGKNGMVIMIDLDNFKEINDIKGHFYGDIVLKTIAKELIKLKSTYVYPSRFGGDEFLILVEYDSTDLREKLLAKECKIIEILESIFNKEYYIEGEEIYVGASIGVSSYPEDGQNESDLIKYADVAMYEAKKNSIIKTAIFNESMAKKIFRKSDIEKKLNDCINSNGFEVLYQPIIDNRTGRVNNFEALIRMKDQSYFPDEFISVAEEKGMILKIGRWVIKEAIEQLVLWKEKGFELVPIAINFSQRQIEDYDLHMYIQELLQTNGIEGKYIEFEIIESILFENTTHVVAFFKELVDIGITLSLDDFGTGYSSLSYLDYLPLTKLKIDKYLIDKDYKNHEEGSLVEEIISLAHGLHIAVVAEGVECKEQLDYLIKINCDLTQGYYFSKPRESESVEKIYNNIFKI